MGLPRSAFGRLSAAAWFAFLVGAMIVAACATNRHAEHVREYPFGCDSFGYLQMARRIRQTDSPFCVDYHLNYFQTRYLISQLKASDIPVSQWDEVVAPHAHHYFPVADAVGPQYPPGAALILAAFPEGEAVRRLNAFDVGALFVIGLTLIGFAAWKASWLAAGFLAVATVSGLGVIAGIGVASFSINAMVIPVLLAVVCASAASWCRSRWLRLALASLASASLGIAVLIRLPIALLGPGLLILLLPHSSPELKRRQALGGAIIWFLVPFSIFGVVPVLCHQQHVAGAWYLPTYAANDSASPSIGHVPENTSFYLRQSGLSGLASPLLLAFALGCLLAARVFHAARIWHFATSALAMWGVPAAYFLTHGVTTEYYAIPSMFATLWLLALGILKVESTGKPTDRASGRWLRRILAAGVGAILIGQTAHLCQTAPSDPPASAMTPNMPAEFRQGKPWIWADMTSGTIVYYANVPTFKLSFGDQETRQRVFAMAFATGERQYLVVDCPSMEIMAAEIEKLGGSLQLCGDVATYPYYLIHWPPDGPTHKPF